MPLVAVWSWPLCRMRNATPQGRQAPGPPLRRRQCAFTFLTAQLLIATILSAQCTDERVNMVTPVLFKTYPTVDDLADATQSEHRADHPEHRLFSQQGQEHQGMLPADRRAAMAAKCRKTWSRWCGFPAWVARPPTWCSGTAFGIPSGVVVDTHVGRLSIRLGLTKNTDAVKVERDLMGLLPRKEWIAFSHRMIHHGRRICVARNPKCEICPLNDICPKIGVVNQKKATQRQFARDAEVRSLAHSPDSPFRIPHSRIPAFTS